MKKLILAAVMLMMVLSSLRSFGQTAYESQYDMSNCTALSAQVEWKAEKMFLEKFKVEFRSIKNPSAEVLKAYAELEKQASAELADDLKRSCGQ